MSLWTEVLGIIFVSLFKALLSPVKALIKWFYWCWAEAKQRAAVKEFEGLDKAARDSKDTSELEKRL